jgi:NO-binding membrane sensor protein with MHYT domain
MGGIAIWCMHFIGNRAIILAGGDARVQISYSPVFTAVSFFIPVIVLFLAFLAVGLNDKVSVFRIALGGALAGLGVCGMHYLGQAGISNYDCVYVIANVVGAAVIAVVASIVALGIFFMFRSTWASSWWKRALCAVILAGAVSGMHWLASIGTQYRLKSINPTASNSISRNSTVIVVLVLVSHVLLR